ncbi:MAG: PilZ domain-containing protein [Nitrospirota bacterium]
MKDAMLRAEALDRTWFAFDDEGKALWLVDQSGRKACPMAWESVQDKAEFRVETRVQVRYRSQDGAWREGRAARASREGVFIEGADLLPVGAEVELSFAPSDRPAERMKGVGTVAWVCRKPDQFGYARGMGVRFLEIMPVRWLQHREAVQLAGQEQQEERGAA